MVDDYRIGPVMPPPNPDDDPTSVDHPMTCELTHRGFALLGEPLFRRAETDAIPVMVVTLGEREAALPLRSLQHEFSIADDSPDGRMLVLIAEALAFVSGLRIGDPLPLEVCTGEASWEPDAMHLALAATRLRVQLVAWLNVGPASDHTDMDAEVLLRLADDPVMRQQVQQAMVRATEDLGFENQQAVVQLLEDLAHELAFVEALRERLLHRAQSMAQKIDRMTQALRGEASQVETVTQVRRQLAIALKEMVRRFEELDAQTGEVMAALRNANSQRAFIRDKRDWLYRSQRAWQSILDEWDVAQTVLDEGGRALLGRTYKFLAPRYMPMTEWLSPARPARSKTPTRQMTW